MAAPLLTDDDRELLRQLMEALDDADLEAQANVRAYRNILLIATLALWLVLGASPLLALWLRLDMVTLHQSSPTTGAEILTVEAAGAFGGLVGALVALHRIQGSRGPYGLPIAQMLLKLPAGALIALFALVIVQSGGIPSIKPVDRGQLVAYAAIFGLVQESVTRMIDKRANDLIGAARDQNDPQRPVTGTAGATPST
jgi:hypothetical protein